MTNMQNERVYRDVVDTEGLAEVLGVAPCTVLQWVRERKIPFFRIAKRLYRFSVSDVLESLREEPGPPPPKRRRGRPRKDEIKQLV